MKKLTLLMAFLYAFAFTLLSQEVQVKGKVTSAEDGSALPGASVVVKGTNTATVTDPEGNYSIRVPAGATTLVVSFVGMKTQEVEIGGRTTIDISMQPEVIGMEEVVVTALGIKRSEKALGYSAVTIGSEDISQTRTTNLMNSLQGKIAGVSITSSSGAPGSSTKVIIRGFSSITGNNEPLYVIDGIPVNNTRNAFYADNNDVSRTQDFGNRANDLNPDDIESVTILKGAAAALYGSRAANGVIMITTKQGQKGDRFKVEYNGSATFSEPLRL
ncbi:MAG TPA: TonB-dependent receptor plug domain-containing protein, partial [Bacteroidales bacterium]|nr:TonB-dependent receptor plug domain-containing protein [Bacteroidales bacterium]